MDAMESQRLDQMEEKLTMVDGKLDQVLSALKGDQFGASKGLVKEILALKERVSKLETLKNRVIWMAVGAGFTGGIGIVKIIQ